MQPDDYIRDQLRQSALGQGLDAANIEALSSIALRSDYPVGTILFTEGCSADVLSVVCSGSVALDMYVPARGSVRILTLGTGDLLGWSSIVGDNVMTATATVLEDVILLNLAKTSLRNLCDADHTLGYGVMNLVARSLAGRLRGTRLQLLDLFSESKPTSSQSTGIVHP